MPEGLPAGWASLSLDKLGTVERGRSRHRPRNAPFLYGGKHPFIQTGDVKAAGLRVNSYSQTYSDLGLAQSRMWPTGTLCITIAANICETAILGLPACFPDSIVGFTANSSVADAVFVKYALDHQKQRFSGISQGTTQENLSVEKMLTQHFPVPPLVEQKRIASILSAYDDLVEVNRRRVAILEEMARRLFEEWFVHLRFPGHESVPVHDTPDGPLPEGWVAGVVGDLLTLHRGYDLATNDRSPGEVPVMTGSGRNGTHGTFKIAAPGVVTGRSGTIGPVFLVHENFWPLNTALYVSSFTCVGPAFALFLLRKLDLRARAGGAAVPTLNRNHVHALPALRPPAAIVQDYERLAAPALELAWVLEQQSGRLAAARDLLLPRLVSGEISVADAPASDRLLDAAD